MLGLSLSVSPVALRRAGISNVLALYDFAKSSYPAVSLSRGSAAAAVNAAGTWQSFASDTLRVTNLGASFEGAQTNFIGNNSGQGAVAGTPGTAPTRKAIPNAQGLTYQIVGTGTENGIDGFYVRYSGTATGTGSVTISLDTGTTTAAQGQNWTLSTFWRVTAGSTAGIASFSFRLPEFNNTTSLANNTIGIAAPTAALSRPQANYTLAQANTNNIKPQLLFAPSAVNAAIDITLFIGGDQLERLDNYVVPARVITSPIRTAGSPATRAGDAASIVLPSGASKITYTFDDGSTQQVSVAPGSYTIPQTLNRAVIARAAVLP